MDFRSLVPFGWSGTPARRGEAEDPFTSFRREIDRLVDEAFRGRGLARWPGETAVDLRLDVSETDKELKVTTELPGVDEKDVEVTLSGDLLTIKGEKKLEQERKEDNFHMVERSFGSFARSLRLPYAVDQDKVSAAFDKGVLTIIMPKPAEAQKAARRIKIKAAK
jgi:HSP20 family protein